MEWMQQQRGVDNDIGIHSEHVTQLMQSAFYVVLLFSYNRITHFYYSILSVSYYFLLIRSFSYILFVLNCLFLINTTPGIAVSASSKYIYYLGYKYIRGGNLGLRRSQHKLVKTY